jgi:hypothetical protein
LPLAIEDSRVTAISDGEAGNRASVNASRVAKAMEFCKEVKA